MAVQHGRSSDSSTHLEGAVHRLHRVLKHVALRLATCARAVAVECVRLALEVHLLQLALVAPGRVLDRQVDVGGVGAGGVGEHAGGGVAQALQAQLVGLWRQNKAVWQYERC